jgi:predicted dienelactone hydrolase
MESTCGLSTIAISDERTGTPFRALVFYPSTSPESEQRIGPYTLSAAENGDCAAGGFPLVVISHGSGGSHLLYRSLAASLARNGYIVVSPEHPGNNSNNNEMAGTERLLKERPRQLRVVIDCMLRHTGFADHLDRSRVAIIGHSIGGYTALAVAGGRASPLPRDRKHTEQAASETLGEARVQGLKALVLLAPATIWFSELGSLDAVDVPILLITAEKDELTPAVHADIVRKGVPQGTIIEHQRIPNAGHFSFLTPFPAALVNPQFAPSQDPPGFDRPCFHQRLNRMVLRFFEHHL